MQIVLSDHDCWGQAKEIEKATQRLGLTELVPISFKRFSDVGLPTSADDETVWRFCQEHGYLLLTGNRSTKDGSKSLELVIRRLITINSLPVLTISNLQRVKVDPDYCKQCAKELVEIVFDLERYRGVMRLFLPSEAVSKKG